MKRYLIRVLPQAEEHIERLFDHELARELTSPTGDPQVAVDAMHALRIAFDALSITSFTCGKAGEDPLWRELVIPFGRTCYIALFEIHGVEVSSPKCGTKLKPTTSDECAGLVADSTPRSLASTGTAAVAAGRLGRADSC